MLLYIHIPFCKSLCPYCTFGSFVGFTHFAKEYLEALKQQFIFEIDRFKLTKNSIETIYIGGGTPSILDANFYEELFLFLSPFIKSGAEISIESNPNSLKKEWIEALKSFGVNRFSLGVQSFDEKKLKLLGRSHSKKDAIDAIELLKNSAQNFSIDLIYDTPIDSFELLSADLFFVGVLEIPHISTYSLIIEDGSEFAKKDFKKSEFEFDYFIRDSLKEFELKQYEVSNYGRECLHNIGYWELKDYIGLGCSAVGFLENRRFYTHKDIKNYIDYPLFCSIEKMSEEEAILEKIFLGFRSRVGVDISILDKKCLDRAEILLEENKIQKIGNKLFNSEFFLADEISLFLIK